MSLIIAGGRDLKIDDRLFDFAVDYFNLLPNNDWGDVGEIVSGGASGIDAYAKDMAERYNLSFKEFPADWNTHGRAAGPIRNRQMAEYADALLLIWNGESRGSASMKREMESLGKPVYEIVLKK